MKKFYFLLMMTVMATLAFGQTLLVDNFTGLTTGTNLAAQSGWTKGGTGPDVTVQNTTPLTYTGYNGGGGEYVVMPAASATASRVYKALTSTPAPATNTFFYSALINLSTVNATGDYFLTLGDPTTGTNYFARLFAKSSGIGYVIGGGKNVNVATANFGSTVLNFNQTYLVVVRYSFVTGTANDEMYVWVNPSLAAEPQTSAAEVTVTTSLADATPATVGNFLWHNRSANNPTGSFDGVRVAYGATSTDAWTALGAGSVVAQPTLSAGTLSDFGSVNVGSSSASQNFSLSGSNLTGAPGNLTVTAPSTDFQVSNNNSTWGSSTTVAYSTGTLAATPVYVRFTPQSAGAKSGNVTIAGGGATTVNVAVSGTGVIAAPSAPVATAATGVGSGGFTANWNAVSGATDYRLDVYTLATGTMTGDVAGWNFDVNTAASQTADLGNANNNGIQTVTANGGNASTFTWPAGPSGASGTPNPYSVSTPGWDNSTDFKYWQIDLNTSGVTNLTLSSLQGSSGTGPANFKVQYKVGSTGTWTDVTGGTVTLTTAVAAGNLATWGALSNLALPAAVENQPLVSIRWIQTSATSINGTPVASTGTSRISAIYVKGTLTASVPTYVTGYQDQPTGNVTSYAVTGLSPNTTYYYVVRAVGPGGTSASSNQVSVTTASLPPAVSATALTAFGASCLNTTAGPNSFTINGSNLTAANVTVGPLAGYTFSTTAGGTYTNSLTLTQTGGTFSQQVFVKFTPTTVQSYNGNIPVAGGGVATAINVAASGSGINTMPTVSSGAASGVNFNSATVGGSISATGCSALTAYGIEYSTTSGFVNGTQAASTNLSGSNFTSALSGLAPNTTYYYKAYATNAGGTAYGTEQSFTTTAAPVASITATPVADFGAVCLNATGGPNSFTITGTNLTTANVVVGALPGFSYSTTSGGTYTSTLTLNQTGGAYSQQVFVNFTPTAVQSYNGNIAITGGGTTAATNVPVTGSGVNTQATVATGAASGITSAAATLAGTISATGCSAVTAYGVEYSTTNNFPAGTGTQAASTNLSGTAFTSSFSGLAASTTYYYRAYATNGGGTAYGAQQSFTTAAPPAPVLTTGGTVTDFGSVIVGNNSASQSFTISGANLTGAPGVITITAPSTDFQVSNNNTSWGASTTINYTAATLAATTVYVRFTPQSAGTKSGNLSITGGGVATAVTVAVSGTGAALPVPVAPVATAATAVNANGFTANWNAVANASGYRLDVYTLGTGPSNTVIAGWNFGVNTAASQTADLGTAGNINVRTVTLNGGNTGTITWPAGPSGASGTPNPYSVSSTAWDNGADAKYWQIDVNTTGVTNLTLSSLQGSSNTGPANFKVQYKVGTGGTWTDVAGGTVTITTAPTPGTPSTFAAVTDLPLPAAAENQPLVYIRWIQTSNTSVNGSVVANTGTSRISAIYVKGSTGTSTIPVYVPGYQNLPTGNVTSYLVTGLTPTTTYYYVVRAENASGTSPNSNEITVTTPVSTQPAITATALTAFGTVCVNTAAGPNSFTINGVNLTTTNITVGPLAGYTFSTTAGGTYTNSLTLTQTGGTFSQQVFVKLTPTALQSYNGNIPVTGGGITGTVNVAANGSGINTAPTVTTGAATGITNVSATAAGTITANGCSAVTAYGVEYSTVNNFPTGTGTVVASTNATAGAFTASLAGLALSTTYYYRAFATNGGGTSYGTLQSFTTAATPPVTLTAGTLAAFGNVCLNTTAGPSSFTITGSNLTNAPITVSALNGYTFATTATGSYAPTLTLNQPGGTYSQQVFVQFMPTAVQSYNGNISITGGGATGTAIVIASGAGINTPPSVTTGAAANITTYSAQLSGSIGSTGCAAANSYGIEYSGVPNFAGGTGTAVPASTLSGGSFTVNLTGLVQGAKYYYRAYANSNGGSSYGTIDSFRVTGIPNAFVVYYPVPALRGSEVRFSVNNLQPGYHALVFYNSAGQRVFVKGFQVQGNYLNEAVRLPLFLSSGVYRVQLINNTDVLSTRSIWVQ